MIIHHVDDWQTPSDVVVRHYDAGGNPTWQASFVADKTEPMFGTEISDCAVSADGSVYLSGEFWSRVELVPGVAQWLLDASPWRHDAYVVKLAPGGAPLWKRQFGGDKGQFANAIAVSQNGATVLVGGGFDGSIDLGDGRVLEHPNAASGSVDAFVAALDAENGELLWKRVFGTPGFEVFWRLKAAPDGAVYALGSFEGGIELGGHPLSAAGGGKDLFLLKIVP